MILTLHIKNIGIIDDITINLENGFNCLTGEAGAGKSLIIESIGLLCGNRFSKEIIRKNSNFSLVEATIFNKFENRECIISREMFLNGRNVCKIDGRLTTVNDLRLYMNKIIDIHGQHENQNLMDISNHIKYLDEFIGKDIKEIKEKYKELYLNYNNLRLQLKNNYGDEKARQRELDLLQYQFEEIENANLKIGEDEKLDKQRKQMANQEKIKENLSYAQSELNSNVIDGIEKSINALEKIENFNENYKNILEVLKSTFYELQEAERDLYNFENEFEFDNYSREEIENRFDLIHSLKRKYGNSIEEIIEYKNELQEKINNIKNSDEINDNLRKEISKVKSELMILAKQMNEKRNVFGETLSQSINNELKDLEMNNARFKVKIDEEEKLNENGLDKIEFLICTNIGDEFKSLSKTASGGELSRIMLAIKTVLTEVDQISAIIFDEIDTGISGVAAKAVSEKMKKIARNHQIFVVTHLAVIAASSDYNLFAYKEVVNNQTISKIKLLEEEEFVKEIARISSGNISQISIEHAKELIQNSKVA